MSDYTTKPYEPNWPHGYVTHSGRPARIICVDRAAAVYPIVALVLFDDSGTEHIQAYTVSGRCLANSQDSCDLLCIVPKPEPRIRHIVEDKFGKLMVYHYADDTAAKALCADTLANGGRVIKFIEVLPEDTTP